MGHWGDELGCKGVPSSSEQSSSTFTSSSWRSLGEGRERWSLVEMPFQSSLMPN